MQPKFLYFDLGKVLINFSVEQMLSQMAAVAGVTAAQARNAVVDGRLIHDHEAGRLSSRQFYEAFCTATGTRPDFDRLAAAAAEIFGLNLPVLPIVAQLRQAGYRMGILSNTCETHWEYCWREYRILSEAFGVHALSYKLGAVKPEAAIFRAAAALAGCRPEEMFFVDGQTVAETVSGAFCQPGRLKKPSEAGRAWRRRRTGLSGRFAGRLGVGFDEQKRCDRRGAP
jgi:FMN phosphatase YigB (HAD superfamily)